MRTELLTNSGRKQTFSTLALNVKIFLTALGKTGQCMSFFVVWSVFPLFSNLPLMAQEKWYMTTYVSSPTALVFPWPMLSTKLCQLIPAWCWRKWGCHFAQWTDTILSAAALQINYIMNLRVSRCLMLFVRSSYWFVYKVVYEGHLKIGGSVFHNMCNKT